MTRTRFAVPRLRCSRCSRARAARPAGSARDVVRSKPIERSRDARAANAELLAPATFTRGLEAYAAAESDLTRGRNMERIRSALATARARSPKRATRPRSPTSRSRPSSRRARTRPTPTPRRSRPSSGRRPSESFDFGRAPARERRHSRRTQPSRRGGSAVSRRRAHGDQGAVLEPDARAARGGRSSARAAPRADDVREGACAARRGRARAQREPLRHGPAAQPRAASQLRSAARHLSRGLDRAAARGGSVARGPHPELRATAHATSAPRPTRPRSSTRASSPSPRSSSTYIEGLREQAAQAERDLTDTRTRVGELEEEIRDLDERLGGVSQERVALVQRLEAEARIREQFAAIENMFARDEARVSREGNRMVIRLVGLTFQSGQDVVRPGLSGAAREAAAGGRGVPALADRRRGAHGLVRRRREQSRAVAAARRGRQRVPDEPSSSVPAFRISSVGYGETQPIANNDTEQGRERNRRIDVIIEPQLESAPPNPPRASGASGSLIAASAPCRAAPGAASRTLSTPCSCGATSCPHAARSRSRERCAATHRAEALAGALSERACAGPSGASATGRRRRSLQGRTRGGPARPLAARTPELLRRGHRDSRKARSRAFEPVADDFAEGGCAR